MTDSAQEDPEALRIVAAALEMREDGIDPPVRELCGERADLIDIVTSALSAAERLPGLGSAAESYDALTDLLLLGRYRLLERIGAGAMGYVYRGRDEDLGRDVAIKVLRSDLFGGEEAEKRFLREAEALAAVHHPAVATVYDRGRTDDGLSYLVMELVDGVPLDDLVRAGREHHASDSSHRPAPIRDTRWMHEVLGNEGTNLERTYVRQCVRWAAELAKGLEAAHDAGVIHRDVKPSNVIVRRTGEPVLIDFGIAALDAGATLAGDRTGPMGTPSFMAPERLDDVPLQPNVDVYGLTATLYCAITLEPPYRGTSTQVLARLRRRDPAPARTFRDDLPRDLQAILDTGLERDVGRRYRTASELREDLDALLENRPVAARPISPLGRLYRSAKRSREFKAVAAIAILAFALWGSLAWLDARERIQKEKWLATWASVPSSLCIAPASMRRIRAEDTVALETARLDRLVELADTAVPSRVVRAAFRLDHGDRAGAVTDATAVDDELGTAVSRELAKRYVELEEEKGNVSSIDLPPPTGPQDRYLLALHLLRDPSGGRDRITSALEQLQKASRSLPYAAEIELMVRNELALHERDVAAQRSAFRAVRTEALELKNALGTVTASTALSDGLALAGLERYAEATVVLEAGVSIAPSDHGLRISLANALRHVGRLDEAREHLLEAVRIRPRSIGAHAGLVDLELDLGRHDEARRIVGDTPYPDDARGRRRRAAALAEVEFERALQRCRDGEVVAAKAPAQAALRHYSEAGHAVETSRKQEILVCRTLADGIVGPVFEQLVLRAAETPTDWRATQKLAALMPERLDAQEIDAIRSFFRALAARSNDSPELPSRFPEDEPHSESR